MQVYKFGGASVKNADGIKNLSKILTSTSQKNIIVIISAIGKTTNALEEVTLNYFNHNEKCHLLLNDIKKAHLDILSELFENNIPPAIFDDITNAFVEIEWVLEEEPVDTYDFIYDQIVSVGELISTKIVSHYLNHIGLSNKWLDARSYIKTNNKYRQANVNWNKTRELIAKDIPNIISDKIAITQGFIGNTSENFNTTLGREGSDYSAAIFANCLNAENITVWKDVPGILNADPKIYADTVKIAELSYAEAIEITFYGANVIHPKTIKPLQNKNIPLYVKSFLASNETGTVISANDVKINTSILINKNNQVLVNLSSKDFSFFTEQNLSDIFQIFADNNIKINAMQLSALSFSVCFDFDEFKFNPLKNTLENKFNFEASQNLKLITIRHATEDIIKKHINTANVVLEQKSRKTAQFVLEN